MVVFVVFGIPLLVLATIKDTILFGKDLFRDDVKQIGHNDCKEDYDLNEAQFIMLESFVSEEYRKLQK